MTDQGDLASSEIKIDPIYVPNEGSRRAQITNFRIFLCEWLLDHPFERPNLLMITEDMYDFITTLFRLRMDTFSILLSQPPSAKGPLLDVGYCVWSWSNLAQGGPPISEAERNLRDFINITWWGKRTHVFGYYVPRKYFIIVLSFLRFALCLMDSLVFQYIQKLH